MRLSWGKSTKWYSFVMGHKVRARIYLKDAHFWARTHTHSQTHINIHSHLHSIPNSWAISQSKMNKSGRDFLQHANKTENSFVLLTSSVIKFPSKDSLWCSFHLPFQMITLHIKWLNNFTQCALCASVSHWILMVVDCSCKIERHLSM